MYVSWETYKASAFASEGVSEPDYPRLASLAEAVIDDWTLWRVGEAYATGEALPECIVNLYAAIVSNIPQLVEDAKSGAVSEPLLTSFSNGVDSFGFEAEQGVSERLRSGLQWMVDALPIEWQSSCVYAARRSFHAC